MNDISFQHLIELCRATHQWLQHQAARSVDMALVVRNWLFGFYVVEFENGAAARAELHGKELIKRLSHELKRQGLKGTSTTNLKQCRSFYLAYPKIGQTPSDQSFPSPNGLAEIRQTLSDQSFPDYFDSAEPVRSPAVTLYDLTMALQSLLPRCAS